ncbi:MAG: PQQ-binding-like beta-propeller repeat protein [Verrucomicrobiales bacterium]
MNAEPESFCLEFQPSPATFRGRVAKGALAVLGLGMGLAGIVGQTAFAEWPLVRGDAARSGWTAQPLEAELTPRWVHRPQHPPEPAWPREERMIFDRAFHVVAARGLVFFGSSSEGTVTALDAATGDVRWTYFTGGPVRFAPAVANDRVFVVSDDGLLRAVAIEDGRLLQQWRGGPEADLVLGNRRIVSRHPARGAPAIVDGTLYYASGIWQSEGIHLTAIDLDTGEVAWSNDSAATIDMPQPHGGADAESGVTIQGYIAATGTQLFVPTGRAVPAAFNRADGEFQYYHLQKFGKQGGSEVMAAGEEVFNVGADYKGTVFHASTGDSALRLEDGAYAALPDGVLHADGKGLRFLERNLETTIDRRGGEQSAATYEPAWKIDGVPGGQSLIVAGNTAVSAGGGKLATVDLAKREVVWTTDLDGTPYGLAAAGGRLFVSLDDGSIHCFAPGGEGDEKALRETRPDFAGSKALQPSAETVALAEAILEQSDIEAGYCADLGCGDGSLAQALAERSELHIVALDPDPATVAQARLNLAAAGLYGTRVTVLQSDLEDTRLPKFVFNLVVSSRLAGGETLSASAEAEAERLQRPYGGVTCLGPAEALEVSVRGAPADAGEWTHQYADSGNTGSSVDGIKGPLEVLWYHDIDLDIPQRHGRAPAPLFAGGRLFVMGMDELLAADAYNGRELWRFPVPGALRDLDADHLAGTAVTGSPFCLADGSLYVRQEGVAHRLDGATGEIIRTFTLPGQDGRGDPVWGFIACRDGILYGSAANADHVVVHGWRPADMSSLFSESKSLVAFDVESGDLLWRYDADESIRHNSIAIAEGRVFLIDRAVAEGDLLSNAEARRGEEAETFEHPPGKLLRLNARTGEEEWSQSEEIWGTMLAYSEPRDMLLMSYQSTRFKLPSETGGRLAVFHGEEGYRLWEREANYNTRPLIRDESIVSGSGSWDLQSGEELPFDFSRSYGCGQMAASEHLLLFRSATLGYFDTSSEEPRIENFGGVRPGCWINALPAGGLVLLPDASAGCSCSYQNRSWIAFQGSN